MYDIRSFRGDDDYWDFNFLGHDGAQFDRFPRSLKNQISKYNGRQFCQTLLAIS
jgi:hypothetical protein